MSLVSDDEWTQFKVMFAMLNNSTAKFTRLNILDYP